MNSRLVIAVPLDMIASLRSATRRVQPECPISPTIAHTICLGQARGTGLTACSTVHGVLVTPGVNRTVRVRRASGHLRQDGRTTQRNAPTRRGV